ncbi:carbohydrate kinase [Solibacillus sp. R5-41]|uniref:carbohydrate kinase family protein n=1 Tax=Solibacillus sp. R5-41 TaxID=2048654 RepID=UPI000C126183|nr:carbohydrate kinase [Solibacillus sp. R5-41]ATP39648.1 carbohydrate kinase [Solibacillus sp. R5-41]
MKQTILCIGELLVDFFCQQVETDLKQGKTFEKHAGGAPANVCATIVKLGGQAEFCGKVGADQFGHFLETVLTEAGVGVSHLVKDTQTPTTLAFVSRKKDGERDFQFFRGADEQLQRHEVTLENWNDYSICHFGSATALLSPPFCNVYREIFEEAVQQQRFVSFDPNYRADLWINRQDEFVEKCKPYIEKADFIKVSEEELVILTNEKNSKIAIEKLHEMGAKLIAVTLGNKGSILFNGKQLKQIPSVPVNSVDSTGAGDAFVGAILFQLSSRLNPKQVELETLCEMVHFANCVGAIVCEKVGAIAAIPTYDEIVMRRKIKLI